MQRGSEVLKVKETKVKKNNSVDIPLPLDIKHQVLGCSVS